MNVSYRVAIEGIRGSLFSFLIFCLPLHSESTDIKLGLISIQSNKSVSPSPGPADQLKKWKFSGSSSRLSRSRWRVVTQYPTRWSLLFIVQLCTRWRGDCRRSPSSSGWDSSSPPPCSAFPGSSSPTSSFSQDSGSLACSIWPGSTTTSPRATGRESEK